MKHSFVQINPAVPMVFPMGPFGLTLGNYGICWVIGIQARSRGEAHLRATNRASRTSRNAAAVSPRLSDVSDEPKTLLLRETGIARLEDGSEAVNVGPIVVALGFLTEGRGDDRGTDEHGTPLPDLLSLAFDVVQSIILGGRPAEYFRKVKLDFDTQSALSGKSSLSLAKHAATVRRSAPSSALEKAAGDLRARLEQLDELPLDEEQLAELKLALQGFRDFGAERWVAATSHLLLALNALDRHKPSRAAHRRPRAAKAMPDVVSPPAPKRRRPAQAKPAAKKTAKKAKRPTTKSRAKKSNQRR